MLLTVSFRLMFSNTVSKDGCDMKKSVIVKRNFIFVRNLLGQYMVSFYCLFRYLITERFKIQIKIQEVDIYLSTVSISCSEKVKQGIDRKLSNERLGRFGQSSRKIETVITISVTITVITNTNYLAGFKREKQLKLR